ncbi:hypothetical protein [Phenylobacterium soli]|uniref:Uncharacterized protein n=1 Tax=Phenylobacterium soli TaxID=2170551 RepID=A0A328AFB0_9CAUL|nr:hypothetical protein [Phenylobacterium soli]RAK53217.1 hypothetical protein DJ017_01080 [Phenylobacterium soli]
MNPVIRRLGFIFVGIFFVINLGLLIWHFGWEVPRQKCEAGHKWWDAGQRVCATPILTSDITGRLIDNPQAREEALRAIGRLPPKAAPAPAAAAKPATK